MFRDDRFDLGLVERRQRCRDDAGLIGISDVRVGVAGVRMLAGMEEPVAGAVSLQAIQFPLDHDLNRPDPVDRCG